MSTASFGSQSDVPAMISDGKRMRAVWRHKDGHGDSTQHVIDRVRTTLHGHPTWRIYVNDFVEPIVRGSEHEPPRYVYLDDKVCHAIWTSKQYNNEELRTYWPFDFDHQGNIKTGRPNRGRPAWTDGDVPEIAKGRLRGKKTYEFSGEPDVTEYAPVRPKMKTRMELEVEAEWAARKAQNAGSVSCTEGTPATADNVTTPGGTPINDTHDPDRSPPTPRTARLEKVSNLRSSPPKYPPPPPMTKPKPKQSIKDAAKVKPIPSPYSSTPVTPPKRKVGPFIDNSNPSDSSGQKRTKLDERSSSVPAPVSPTQIAASPARIAYGNQGGERSSSLPAELPPGVGRDELSEEEDFLAREYTQDTLKLC
ncbi:hypothetical protein BU23DRAFT_236150 [Bimuria novae-zelandiae CBS 107.79]|uniref:Uncharacterized protein n=1 Tax=Bimuria novae-zelandiae CBS 107.79 TaxID=1447943 RepID=A0A6A5UXV9_9PLEO|nr:hypothetical protein BU23DRAFT_236150 [Bimuria novae-zelandiae CBS 107.79]